ncbi:uncharacterized protein LOC129773833 [Toxorhynchites rutilus septentrionalis]|uniref:uncharacterized protein LOC129773833 n=1 Tax=Toxorhynchites rutilus septentrionalis TaxID=329112 RepID=UPI0024789EBF|nr:uncharacterized protein LOC129773833 [Toxorhynchites rutilus septentrionalis]
MSAKEAGANQGADETMSQTPEKQNTGGCVNCSRPDSYDNFVQCDQCDGWWHMRCAGVTASIAERPWTCRNCLPSSVHSKATNRSAQIALRLKKLEEERAIQQRAAEAEKRAIEQDRKLMQEKFALMEEQLEDEREKASNRSQVSRRSREQRVTEWVQQQSSNEGAVGGVPEKQDAEAGRRPSVAEHQAEPNPVKEPPMQRGEILVDPSKHIRNQQRNTGAIPKTVQNCQIIPTTSLAARQIMPRDLPPFAGNPADWPIFISSFVNTTAACGYSSVENLTRLQRCLKGSAYEAVRSRLLLPESVPQVINTLQLLYGRPELLINVLLDKVRSTPAPKAERLETLIEFGMAVQSLCDHLEAAGQQSHLMNPCLLMELVEKLPAHVKMEWASFMQRFPEVNLKTFGTFMDGIVVSASKVPRYTGGYGKGASVDKSTTKNRGSINTHVSQPEVPKKEDKPCGVCKRRGHRVRDCDNFKALSVDDRWKTAQDNELCRSCLNAHGRRSCRSATQCGINGCPFRHHPLLHSNRSNRPSSGSTAPRVAYNIETAGNHAHRMQDQSLLFRIIPVTLYGPKRTVKTFAFLDDGSSLTLVEEELTNKIGIDGIPAPLCLTWTGNVSRIEAESKQLQLEVSSANGGKHHQLKNVRTVKKLALPGQTLRINEFVDRYKHLRGLPLSGYENAVPQLLIGVNNLRFTLPLKVKEGDSNEPVAMKTRLGWCVYGGIDTSLTNAVNFHACDCDSDRALHELVKDYFTLEDVGSRPKNELLSADDRRAQHILEKTTTRVGNQFETGLLWRYDEVEFPDSYGMALRRLECLERRMVRNPLLKEKIHRQIEEYQQKGYTHRANEEEVKAVDPRRVWYLPLGAVVNPKKPEKVRLIWDAAAVVDGISLNAMLLKGPDQLTSLPAVLSRFRQFAVAVAADI